jgi:predicted DNA-binding protein
MSVMSIRISDDKRKKLKAIASLEGKTISGLVSELIG